MSVISIKYSILKDTCTKTKRLSNTLSEYAEEIHKKVSLPISELPGNDNRGYAQDAASSAKKKISELQNNSSRFSAFSQSVERFSAVAKQADKTVETSIRQTASSYVGERSAWESFFDNLYNTCFVDFFNATSFGRFIKDCTTTAVHDISAVGEKIRDWFKHGKGRYVWNIVSGVVASIAAIGAAISACAAVAAAAVPAAAFLAAAAATAAVVGAVITVVNSGVKCYNNAKALNSDDPGVSRYVGTIDGFSDAVKKYDMGDAYANAVWEASGVAVDKAKAACDLIGIVKGATDLGAVKSEITGRINGYRFDKETILRSFRKRLGFDFDKNKFTPAGALGFTKKNWDTTKTWTVNENGYGGLKSFMNMYQARQDRIRFVFNSANVINKAQKTVEKVDSVYEILKTGFDFSSSESTFASLQSMNNAVIGTYEAMGFTKIGGGLVSTFIKPIKTVTKLL